MGLEDKSAVGQTEKIDQERKAVPEEKAEAKTKELTTDKNVQAEQKVLEKPKATEKIKSLEEKVIPEEKTNLEQKTVLEKKSKDEPEKVIEKKDENAFTMAKNMDGLLIGSSIAILYAYLEYSNAKDASKKMKSEEYLMNTASAYADARYHQGKAEGYSDRVDYHYQNTTNAVVIAAGLFAWKVWKSINQQEVPNISFYPPTADNDTATLSWNCRF